MRLPEETANGDRVELNLHDPAIQAELVAELRRALAKTPPPVIPQAISPPTPEAQTEQLRNEAPGRPECYACGAAEAPHLDRQGRPICEPCRAVDGRLVKRRLRLEGQINRIEQIGSNADKATLPRLRDDFARINARLEPTSHGLSPPGAEPRSAQTSAEQQQKPLTRSVAHGP